MAITVSLRKFIGLIAYPPGTIYTCASDIDPAKMWGGEWEKLTGTFLWAADEARPLGSIGGEVEHILIAEEMPTHTHLAAIHGGSGSYGRSRTKISSFQVGTTGYADSSTIIENGGNQPHNNMPPYLSVNMWKRLSAFSSGGVHPNPLKSLFQRRCLLWHCL